MKANFEWETDTATALSSTAHRLGSMTHTLGSGKTINVMVLVCLPTVRVVKFSKELGKKMSGKVCCDAW